MSPPNLLTIVLVPLIVGLELIRRGRRGYAIDDHPICRRCGFDLFGLPSGSTRCSECGSDLSRRRATRCGTRVRLRGLVGLGLVLVLSSLTGIGFSVRESMGRTGTAPYKPVWLLIREARNSDPNIHQAAFDEIRRRHRARNLSDAARDRIVDVALHEQQHAAVFNRAWGELIEDFGKDIGKDRWDRYQRQAVRTMLVVRSKVPEGSPIAYRVNYDVRLGTQTAMRVHTVDEYYLDGFAFRRQHGLPSPRGSTSTNHPSVIVRDGLWQAPASPAQHLFRIQSTVAIMTGGFDTKLWPGPSAEATFEIVPNISDVVRPIDDPTQIEAIRASIRVDLAHRRAKPTHLIGQIAVSPNAVPLAFDVFAKQGDREWRLTSIAVAKGQSLRRRLLEELQGFEGGAIDLIFRPSPAAAAATVDLTEYWNGTIEIKDVQVATQG